MKRGRAAGRQAVVMEMGGSSIDQVCVGGRV